MPTFGLCRLMIHTARSSGPTGVTQIRGNEEVVHTELGQVGTQFNALPHSAMGDLLDNCIKIDDLATCTGFTKLGVEKVGALFAPDHDHHLWHFSLGESGSRGTHWGAGS
jgi:hypothetical protein